MMPAVSPSSDRQVAPTWQVIVPVRGGSAGKSRLTSIEGVRLTGPQRRELALAMAHDTVSAAVALGRGPVTVLTGDGAVASMAAECGATTATDHGRGLNPELAEAAAAYGAAVGVAVLLGDLPALRPVDLGAALDLARDLPEPGLVVPDGEGTGTTLVAGTPGAVEAPPFRFGAGSAQRHQRAGLHPGGLHLDRLRADVDTPEGWAAAVRLGLGPTTSALRLRLLAAAH